MNIHERLTKVEVEVENCKEGIVRLERAIEDLRTAMERGFAEQRRELNMHLRWIYGLIFTNMTFTFGVIAHIVSKL